MEPPGGIFAYTLLTHFDFKQHFGLIFLRASSCPSWMNTCKIVLRLSETVCKIILKQFAKLFYACLEQFAKLFYTASFLYFNCEITQSSILMSSRGPM